MRLFTAGEIATQDVAADQNLQIEDVEATNRRREQVADAQPPVFDVSPLPYEALAKSAGDIIAAVQNASGDENLEKLRWQIAENLNTDIGSDTIELWRQDTFRDLFLKDVLPWLRQKYEPGIAAATAVFLPYKNGILVREVPSMVQTTSTRSPLASWG